MPKSRRSISRRSTGSTPIATEFNPDYTYVKSDLKRIAILAASFLVVLIALTFFLR